MARCTIISALIFAALAPREAASADARPRLLVLDTRVASGVDPEHGRVVQSLTIDELVGLGRHQVLSTADVAALLDVETQRQLAGCADDQCTAQIAGALGADFILTASLSRLGDANTLALSLIDVAATRVTGSITKGLAADPDQWVQAVRDAAHEVLGLTPPPPAPRAWYRRPWVWAVAGGVVLAGATAGYLLTRPEEPHAPLGVVVLR